MGISGVPLDKSLIIQSIYLKKGIISHAAKHMDCLPDAIYDWMKRDSDVDFAVKDARQKKDRENLEFENLAVDKACQGILDLLDAKDPTAIIFTLKTKRGWKEGAQNLNITVNKSERPYRQEITDQSDNPGDVS